MEHTDVSEKEKRKNIHALFKGSQFETDTKKLEDGGSRIRIFLAKELSKNKRRKAGLILNAPEKSTHTYLHFVMQKENYESVAAIQYLAKKLKKTGKYFTICGNKDKRGITT